MAQGEYISANRTESLTVPRVETLESDGAASVVVGGDAFILTASYARQGDDLVLSGAGGREVLIRDFFRGETPPDLLTEGGARVSGDTALLLAGPLAPGQLARPAGNWPRPPRSAGFR